MQSGKSDGIGYLTGPSGLKPGRPTLVFIHGAGGSAHTWDRQLSDLDPEANTLSVDLPGHGASDPPGRETVSEYASAVIGLLDRLAVPDPIPVGLSMGGATVQTLLLENPGRFARAGLVSTGAKLRVLPVIFERLASNFPGYLDLMDKFAFSGTASPEVKREVLEDTAKQAPAVIAQDFRACDVFNVTDRLPEIKSRVVIVSGADDFLTPPKFSDILNAGIAGSKLVRIAGCGHMVTSEKPAELAAALAGLLKN